MNVEKDFKELLQLFNKHHVKYCIVGAFAVGFYGNPRYTKDLDIWVEPSLENGKKVVVALSEFGFEKLSISPEDFVNPEQIIQLGFEPVRVDLLTKITGCSFDDAWKSRETGMFGDIEVIFLGYDSLIKNKTTSARYQDLADIEKLTALRSKKRK